jgi:hypothetical protein
MSMLPLIIATIVLAVIYGLFWHNQPANERNRAGDDNEDKNGLRAVLGPRRPKVPASRHKVPAEHRVRGKGDTTHANGSTNGITAQVKEASQARPMPP